MNGAPSLNAPIRLNAQGQDSQPALESLGRASSVTAVEGEMKASCT